MIRYIVIGVAVVSFLVFGCPEWLSDEQCPYVIRAALYPLFHGNIAHLAANCLAMWLSLNPKRKGLAWELAFGLAVSFLVYPLAARPIVGVSNALYAICGLRTPSFSSRWWRSSPVITFLVITAVLLLFPQFSAVTHIAAFAVGVLMAHLRRTLKPYLQDVGRYIK